MQFYYLPVCNAVPLAAIILGKDVLLILASFYLRYITVPPPVSELNKL